MKPVYTFSPRALSFDINAANLLSSELIKEEKILFYGSLDLLTGQVIAMQIPLMNEEMTAQHLKQIPDAYLNRPILIFWDRAP